MTGEAAYHSVSVAGAVIDENGRTLVIQRRDNGHWEPPGGFPERDEPVIEGLLREVREETGLIVEPMALTGIYKNMRLGVVALVFRCRPAGGALTENSEAAGFRWIQESEASGSCPKPSRSVFSMLIGMTPNHRSEITTVRSSSPRPVSTLPGSHDSRAAVS
jgi:8-oxo-dGTP diphosphatase